MNWRNFTQVAGVIAAGLFLAVNAQADASKKRLAIQGYDAVAYFTMSKPMVGDPRYQYEWDDAVYRFVSAKHRKMFKADPEHYVPRYQGLCAMGLGVKGYKVVANPKYWVIHDGRLYVTQRSFGPPGFRKAPRRWARKASEHLRALGSAPVGSALSWW